MEDFNKNDEQNDGFNGFEFRHERSTILSVFCILSFINAAFQALMNFVTLLTKDSFLAKIENEEAPFDKMAEQMGNKYDEFVDMMTATLSISWIYYLLMTLCFVASFIGVAKMWKMRKSGFHFYAIAQILILIIPSFFNKYVSIGGVVSSAIFTGLFIWFYYVQSKRMTD